MAVIAIGILLLLSWRYKREHANRGTCGRGCSTGVWRPPSAGLHPEV